MVGKTRGIYEMFEEIIFFLYRMKLGGGWVKCFHVRRNRSWHGDEEQLMEGMTVEKSPPHHHCGMCQQLYIDAIQL